jgi:predicted 2-oxoglutarate/Fe(II)-dependent dioxygenase YbiX
VSNAQQKLPHGSVSSATIKDKSTRDILMRLNENIVSLEKRVAELEKIARRI